MTDTAEPWLPIPPGHGEPPDRAEEAPPQPHPGPMTAIDAGPTVTLLARGAALLREHGIPALPGDTLDQWADEMKAKGVTIR